MSSAASGIQSYAAGKASEKKTPSVLNVPVRNTSFSGACFNLTKSAVGAGTVYLPKTICNLGMVAGSSMFMVAAFLCGASLHFLGRMAHHCETGDYFRLGRLALGLRGEQAVSVALMLFLIGGLIAYSHLIGQFFSQAMIKAFEFISAYDWFQAMDEDSFGKSLICNFFKVATKSNYMTAFWSIAAVFPLSLMRDMSKLAKTSILGMICMVYIAGIFAWEALVSPLNGKLGGTEVVPIQDTLEYVKFLGSACGKLVFAFVNHFTMVSLVPVMVDPSSKKRSALLLTATVAAVLIYSTVIYGSVYRFGGLIGGEVISIYGQNGQSTPMAYTIAQCLLAFVLVCSYPLLCDPARASFDALFFGAKSSISTTFRHYAETAFFVAVPTIVAFFTQDKSSDYLDLFAGVCGSMLVFSFPGMFFLILARPYKYSVSAWEKITARAFVVLGVVLAILCFVTSLNKIIRGA